MKKSKQNPKDDFDPEEKDLLSSFEKNEWLSVKALKKEKEIARNAATKTLQKDVRINIRLSSSDVTNIKQKAAYEGLPYQTLISSILHKYASGHLNLH